MFNVKIPAVLGLISLTVACATSELEEETQRIVDQFNAERAIAESIARGEGFPDLHDAPQQLPERQANTEVSMRAASLVKARDALLIYVRDDAVRAVADRQIVAQIMEDGEVLEMGLEQAAAILRERIASDQQLIFDQLSLPVPKLGGQPPKHLR